MMAFCELNESDEAVELVEYIEHEVSCPFCEVGNTVTGVDTQDGAYYKCHVCDADWLVMGD